METVNNRGVKEYNDKKTNIPMIRSIAMLKMEKNFIAHCDKGYSRQPYKDNNQPTSFLISRLDDELKELKEAFERKDIVNMQEELADLSNIIDYLFEQLCQFRSYSNNLELLR